MKDEKAKLQNVRKCIIKQRLPRFAVFLRFSFYSLHALHVLECSHRTARHTTHINHIQPNTSTCHPRKATLHQLPHNRRITAFLQRFYNIRACRACRACIVSRFCASLQVLYHTPLFRHLPLRCLFSIFIYKIFCNFFYFLNSHIFMNLFLILL